MRRRRPAGVGLLQNLPGIRASLVLPAGMIFGCGWHAMGRTCSGRPASGNVRERHGRRRQTLLEEFHRRRMGGRRRWHHHHRDRPRDGRADRRGGAGHRRRHRPCCEGGARLFRQPRSARFPATPPGRFAARRGAGTRQGRRRGRGSGVPRQRQDACQRPQRSGADPEVPDLLRRPRRQARGPADPARRRLCRLHDPRTLRRVGPDRSLERAAARRCALDRLCARHRQHCGAEIARGIRP